MNRLIGVMNGNCECEVNTLHYSHGPGAVLAVSAWAGNTSLWSPGQLSNNLLDNCRRRSSISEGRHVLEVGLSLPGKIGYFGLITLFSASYYLFCATSIDMKVGYRLRR